MRSYADRVDPELRDAYPPQIAEIYELFLADVLAAQAAHRQARERAQRPFDGDRASLTAPGLDSDPPVAVERFAAGPAFDDCAIVWLHGGGYWAGSAHDGSAHTFAHVAPVYSVEYRLAPQNPAPAAARDVCAALSWLASTVEPRRLVVAGVSAGGGLAASSVLMNRDRSGPRVDLQMLLYPALDDRLQTRSAAMDSPPRFGGRRALREMWRHYLGGRPADGYAAAARADDLSGLPAAYIAVGELDHLRDEALDYAARLRAADVATECAVYPGAPHGFDQIAPQAQVSRRAHAACASALAQVFAP